MGAAIKIVAAFFFFRFFFPFLFFRFFFSLENLMFADEN
jgi:hypothetical protein